MNRHLSVCSPCARAYHSFQGILEGLRQFPRPRAPRLELPRIEDVSQVPRSAPLAVPRIRKLRGLRVAAAVLLFATLALTHFLAFYLGERENRDLAEIGRRELPRVVSELVDDAASQLRFAGELAAEEPRAVARVAFRDDLGQELERVSRTLVQVSGQSTLGPVGEKLRRYAQAHESIRHATNPDQLGPELARLEKELGALRKQVESWQGRWTCPAVALDDPEAVLRASFHALRQDQPVFAGQIVVDHIRQRGNPRLNRALLWIMGQSDHRMGVIREPDLVYNLMRRAGGDGLQVYFDLPTRLFQARPGTVTIRMERGTRVEPIEAGGRAISYPTFGPASSGSGVHLDLGTGFSWPILENPRATRDFLRRLVEQESPFAGKRTGRTTATIIIKSKQDK